MGRRWCLLGSLGICPRSTLMVRVPLALNGAWRRFQVSLAPLYNSIIGNHESFADDLNTQRGTVSARVVLYYDPLRFSPSCLDLVFLPSITWHIRTLENSWGWMARQAPAPAPPKKKKSDRASERWLVSS